MTSPRIYHSIQIIFGSKTNVRLATIITQFGCIHRSGDPVRIKLWLACVRAGRGFGPYDTRGYYSHVPCSPFLLQLTSARALGPQHRVHISLPTKLHGTQGQRGPSHNSPQCSPSFRLSPKAFDTCPKMRDASPPKEFKACLRQTILLAPASEMAGSTCSIRKGRPTHVRHS